ncbi:MAG: dihydrodipicolinate synthase family protein, partial [Terriglobales bacterium]
MRLEGIVAALTTPMQSDGELALERLEQNLLRYQGTPLRGYLVLGSSGEAIALEREEKLAVLRCAARAAAAGGKLLLAGTGEESLRATLAMTAEAAALGYHAAVVRTPHYYKKAVTAAALAGFYRAVADHSPIPVVLYNIPPLTGVDLGLETILELAQHPNIAGLKESSGNLEKLVRLAALRPDFAVMVGGAATIYPSLCVGAAGAILALAAAAPEACCEVEAAFRSGDHDLALAAQRALLPACKAFEPLSIPGLKAAVDAGGYFGGPPRLPLLAVTPAQSQAIAAALAGLRADCVATRGGRAACPAGKAGAKGGVFLYSGLRAD